MTETEEPLFVNFGSALPAFDAGEKQVSKYRGKINTQYKHDLRQTDQIVTDSEGRRRFHGAFTGGFSAGHYMSVGTEEGWTPNNKFDSKKKQSISDFMDDEDISEYGIKPKLLQMTREFDSNVTGRQSAKKIINGYSHNIVPKINATMGIRLLRTMGYVEGRENLAHTDKQIALKRRIILAKNRGNIEKSIELLEQKLKLSEKVQTKSTDFCLPKSNNQTFGVGYVKLSTLSTTRKDSTAVRTEREKSKKFGNFSISGQAFGVGAFEEEDEDIYAQDNMANYDIDITISKARRHCIKIFK